MRLSIWGQLARIAAIATTAAPLLGQEPATQTGDVVIHHRSGRVEIRQYDGRVVRAGQLPETISLTLKEHQALTIRVMDPNPLLFSYEIPDGVQLKKLADFANAKEILGQLKSILDASDLPVSKEIAQMNELGSNLEKDAWKNQLTLPNFAKGLVDFAGGLGEGTKQIAPLQKNIKDLRDHIDAIPSLVEETAEGDKEVAQAKQQVRDWKLSDLARQIELEYEVLDREDWQSLLYSNNSLRISLRGAEISTYSDALQVIKPNIDEMIEKKVTVEQDAAKKTDLQKLENRAQILWGELKQAGSDLDRVREGLLRRRGDVQKLIEIVKAFEKDIARVDEELVLRIGPKKETILGYEGDSVQTLKVKIGVDEDFAKVAKSTGRFTGDLPVDVSPYEAVKLSIAPAYIFSFVRQPTYSAVKQEDGKFKILESGEEYQASTLGAMINIVPRRLEWNNFAVSFQTGVSPVKDKVAFYFGGGALFWKSFSLSLGLGVQQVQKLGSGQNVDDVLVAEGDLKTTTEFKPGLYVGIAITIP